MHAQRIFARSEAARVSRAEADLANEARHVSQPVRSPSSSPQDVDSSDEPGAGR